MKLSLMFEFLVMSFIGMISTPLLNCFINVGDLPVNAITIFTVGNINVTVSPFLINPIFASLPHSRYVQLLKNETNVYNTSAAFRVPHLEVVSAFHDDLAVEQDGVEESALASGNATTAGPSCLPITYNTSTPRITPPPPFEWSILHNVANNAVNSSIISTSFIGPIASPSPSIIVAHGYDHFANGARAVYTCRRSAYVSTSRFNIGICTANASTALLNQTPGPARFRRECIDWQEIAVNETAGRLVTSAPRLTIATITVDHSATRPKEHIFVGAMVLMLGICVMIYGTVDRLDFETPQETEIEQSKTHTTIAVYDAKLIAMDEQYFAEITSRDSHLARLDAENVDLTHRLEAILTERITLVDELAAARETISSESAYRVQQACEVSQLEAMIKALQLQLDLAVKCHANCAQSASTEVTSSVTRRIETLDQTAANSVQEVQETAELSKIGKRRQRMKITPAANRLVTRALGLPNRTPIANPNPVGA
ncbi:hypothetical protein FRB96_009702 [Tulasnella sp. 330]|nr:hypothetical protein FRB96_009702 [Tulasnella sp. 330]KAG8882195.1 hypothetical protein FRB97_008604 [Tulasnella sp. 331]